MRLAYITNVSMPAGDAQSIQARAMAKSFGARLDENFLLLSPLNNENKTVKTDYTWKRIVLPKFLPRAARYLWLIFASTRAAFKFNLDCVYSRDIGVAVWYRLMGFKSAYEAHKPFETKIGHWLFSLFAKRLKIIVISKALRDYICETYEVEYDNIIVAHDGVFLEDYYSLSFLEKQNLKQKLYHVQPDDFVVTYAGSAQLGKGLELFLKVAELASNKSRGLRFAVIGADWSDVRKEDAGDIRYIPRKPHDQVAPYLQCADLLVLPTTEKLKYYKYSSPLKLFEYMASSVPLAASKIGAVTEVIDESMAYLFNAAKELELLEIVNLARSNQAEAQAKAFKAKEEVKKYTWQKRVDLILSFLN